MCVDLFIDKVLVYSNCDSPSPSTTAPSPSIVSDDQNDVESIWLAPSAIQMTETTTSPSHNMSNSSMASDGTPFNYTDKSLSPPITPIIVSSLAIGFCVLFLVLIIYCRKKKPKKVGPAQTPKKKRKKKKCCACCDCCACCTPTRKQAKELPVTSNSTQTTTTVRMKEDN